MLTRDEIIRMISQPEGPLVERKPARVNAREIRQTVVAFANSVSGADEAVLFIGLRDDGAPDGGVDPDATQKTVRDVCEKQCYPTIRYRIEVLHEHQNIVAVVIPASEGGPHFAGAAYVRRGSESVAASEQVFNDLIYSRTSKVAKLIEFKRSQVQLRVIGQDHMLGNMRKVAGDHRELMLCKIADCNSHYVQFQRIDGDQRRFAEPVDHITITYNEEKWCPELIVSGY